MTHLAYPSDLSPSSWTISLNVPGARVYKSAYTGAQNVLSRGIATWSGAATYGPFSVLEDADLINALRGFLASIVDPGNTFDLPIPGLDQDDRFSGDVEVSAKATVGTIAELTLDTSASANAGIKIGDYIQIGERVYSAITNQVGAVVQVTPSDIDAALPEAIEYAAPTLTARAVLEATSSFTITHTADFVEPIVLSWEEVR